MRHIESSVGFRKQLKLMLRRGKGEEQIKKVILQLANDQALAAKYHDHPLTGQFTGFRAFVVAHHDDQSVVVALDIEHHAVICFKARIFRHRERSVAI
jgi:addiction module RelE/StbE family toxin